MMNKKLLSGLMSVVMLAGLCSSIGVQAAKQLTPEEVASASEDLSRAETRIGSKHYEAFIVCCRAFETKM